MLSQQDEHIEEFSKTYFNFIVCYQRVPFNHCHLWLNDFAGRALNQHQKVLITLKLALYQNRVSHYSLILRSIRANPKLIVDDANGFLHL